MGGAGNQLRRENDNQRRGRQDDAPEGRRAAAEGDPHASRAGGRRAVHDVGVD